MKKTTLYKLINEEIPNEMVLPVNLTGKERHKVVIDLENARKLRHYKLLIDINRIN